MENWGNLTRRNFLRLGGLVATVPFIDGVLPIASASGADLERKVQTVFDIPDISVEVKDWKPLDVSHQYQKILDEKDFGELTQKKLGERILCRPFNSFNNRWRVTREHVLDRRSKKVYKFVDGDEKVVGFPSISSSEMPRMIGDNGAFIYLVEWPSEPEGLYSAKGVAIRKQWAKDRKRAMVVADMQSSRKIVLKPKEGSKFPTFWNQSLMDNYRISGNGKTIAMTSPNKDLYSFDINARRVSYKGTGFVEAVNYDGSVIAAQNTDLDGYFRVDMRNQKKSYMWPRNLTRHHFKLSSDGNFCVCMVDDWGKSRLEFYVHNSGERREIDTFIGFPERIDNDGTLHVGSHVGSKAYSYKNGKYELVAEKQKN